MKGKMVTVTIASLILTVIFSAVYEVTETELMLSLAITAGTVSFHFAMRLLTGTLVADFLHRKGISENRLTKARPWEMTLYGFLGVKRWKSRMPTFDPDAFDSRKHSWLEIAEESYIAEKVHLWIFLLSYLPLLATCLFGAFAVFLITSIIASLTDLTFVMMQRYNRTRILALIKKSPQDHRSRG